MPAPFDSVAAGYDAAFTQTRLGRELRGRVWTRLDRLFAPGLRVLELGCGTGEDARHLGLRGVTVLATDAAPGMLEVAERKTAGLPVKCALFDTRALEPASLLAEHGPFDGAFANFGALNALPEFRPLAGCLARAVAPGGRLLIVIMGRWCAWEIGWHLARARPRLALRRLARQGAAARLGEAVVHVYYPSTRELRRAFAPHFKLERVCPLGVLLPPTYLEPLTRRWYFPFGAMAALDRRLAWPLWGDHTVYEWVRVSGVRV